MIATILLRLGIPKWVAVAVLCVVAAGAALAYRSHLINTCVAMESARHAAIDAENDRRARAALAVLNDRLRVAQGQLAAAIAAVDQLKTDIEHEKATSNALQADLAAGRRRLSVLTRARAPDPAGHAPGTGPAAVDTGGAISADLDGRVASDLEWLRQTRDGAIAGLRACIRSYDAVKTASDSQQPQGPHDQAADH